MTKEYISSVTLAQRPLLVLTDESRHTFQLVTNSCLAAHLSRACLSLKKVEVTLQYQVLMRSCTRKSPRSDSGQRGVAQAQTRLVGIGKHIREPSWRK